MDYNNFVENELTENIKNYANISFISNQFFKK